MKQHQKQSGKKLKRSQRPLRSGSKFRHIIGNDAYSKLMRLKHQLAREEETKQHEA